ncbi:tetratricopeptide (TPR) repeat protein [Allocatelliglobosispora scoriae]|uniref:Tetratricopeptide (TPR) repeat protein n=1 Tax=Allocatelliglobosispora scoriae TaxID=643052 RepID=A0A841BID3_9ACTN|nr:hypothetical protein [Allocatelliglobosispora scoriae]MBB5866929.1 tetratricopeptide (TPR) repeat protein [Allocatelliglobosispora scoriae]
MRTPLNPNTRLRALVQEAGWTGGAFAQAVNSCGNEIGLVLRYDRTSVAHWLAGVCPRAPVPALIAEALTRRLGRVISLDATGLTRGGSRLADEADRAASAAGSLLALHAGGPGRSVFVYRAASSPASTTAGTVPAPLRRAVATDVSAADVRAVELMVEVFADADAAFGGGRARTALAGYLAALAPLLHARRPARVRDRLLAVTAQLSYLCGFMHFDDGLHGDAQKYYQTAWELGGHAGRPELAALSLRALSVQARALGHYSHALQLAESALSTGGSTVPPVTRAFLHGQVAVAQGATGDRHAAFSQLRLAEAHLERAAGDLLLGGYHRAALAHQEAAVHAHLGKRAAAAASLEISLRSRPDSERRSRAFLLSRLAEIHLANGHLDRAVQTWDLFLDDYPHLESGRVNGALASMRSKVRPFQRHSPAAALLRRAQRLRR